MSLVPAFLKATRVPSATFTFPAFPSGAPLRPPPGATHSQLSRAAPTVPPSPAATMSARVPVAADSSPESPHLTPDSNASRTRADQSRSPAQGRRTRSRKKTFTREDRAMHSVVERQRRGAFNRLLSVSARERLKGCNAGSCPAAIGVEHPRPGAHQEPVQEHHRPSLH